MKGHWIHPVSGPAIATLRAIHISPSWAVSSHQPALGQASASDQTRLSALTEQVELCLLALGYSP